jgi:hypothetical protein
MEGGIVFRLERAAYGERNSAYGERNSAYGEPRS